MKKTVALLLAACLALALCGCSREDGTAMFYYTRYPDDYLYGMENGVIAGEYRDITSHSDDLKYLLTLYFHGPTLETLRTPFPSGMGLYSVEWSGNTLVIETTSSLTVLTGTDLTLACACLAKTCFSLTDAEAVTIYAGGLGYISMTLTRDSLILYDNTPIPTNE